MDPFEIVGRLVVAWVAWLVFIDLYTRLVEWLLDRDERKRASP